jgi:hypothetical protein
MSDTSDDAVASEPAGASPEPDATAHETDDASHGHGGHDDHGEHAAALGPIDWPAWGAGLIGVGAGLVVALCLYLATSLP